MQKCACIIFFKSCFRVRLIWFMTVVQLVCVRFGVYSASHHFSRVKLALVFLAVSSLKIARVPVYGTLLRGCVLHYGCKPTVARHCLLASVEAHGTNCLRRAYSCHCAIRQVGRLQAVYVHLQLCSRATSRPMVD